MTIRRLTDPTASLLHRLRSLPASAIAIAVSALALPAVTIAQAHTELETLAIPFTAAFATA